MRCPHCHGLLTGHEPLTQRDLVPAEKMSTICWHCGDVAIFVRVLGELTLRKPNPEERAKLANQRVHVLARQARTEHPYSPYIAAERVLMEVEQWA